MNTFIQDISSDNELVKLLGDFKEAHIGYVYSMDFQNALVLTNDAWKERVAGIPHNSFLVASAFNPNRITSSSRLDQEVVLLRVIGTSTLPSDIELTKTRVEHNQRRTADELFSEDIHDGLDPITQSELQYGGLKCRILGTFYIHEGHLRLGSDIENYMTSSRLRVYKPRGKELEMIVNHVNLEVVKKAEEEAKKSGFDSLPQPINIGTVRYTSTDRLHRSTEEPKVPLFIQPTDFLARRTAVLGMTRTGKSNTVKTTISAVALSALKSGIKIGQIVFDLNGEYANANHQDDDSSIADVFGDDCIRYRAVETPGDFKDLRTNFYVDVAPAINLITKLAEDYGHSQQDLEQFLGSSLDEPDINNRSEHYRWQVRKSVFQCILYEAGYKAPASLNISFPVSQSIVEKVQSETGLTITTNKGKAYLEIEDATSWFKAARETNYALKDGNSRNPGLQSSSGKPWVDATLESYLNILARENSRGTPVFGWRAIVPFIPYHSPSRSADVVKEIIQYLKTGKIVILDLSAGPVEVRTILSKRIAKNIFDSSFDEMNRGLTPQNMVVYVEEAHNVIGKKDGLTDVWPRIAKEGAKAKIAFVYATQEPSSIHPNILANTENWFVTHLNNEDELRALGKFYDFSDFHASLKTAQDVGFARIKTLSSPFVIPTQINKFSPAELKMAIGEG